MAYERSNRIRFKDSILERTAKAVKEVQALSFGEDGEQIDIQNEDRALQRLAEQLDHIFLHGLRHVTPGYWAFVQQYTHRDIIQEIKSLGRLSTDLGRSRAWLYKAMNDSSLESFINCFLEDQANVKKYYIDLALLRDKERLSLLLTLISGLDFVSFKLELNVAFFDLVSHVPRSATERQNSLDNLSLHSNDSGTPGSTPITATPEDGNSEIFQPFSSKFSRQCSLQDDLILRKVNEGQLPTSPLSNIQASPDLPDSGGKSSEKQNGIVKRLSLPERPTTLRVVSCDDRLIGAGKDSPRGGEPPQSGVVFLKDRKRRSKKRRSSRKSLPPASDSPSPSTHSGNSANDSVQELLDATARTLQGQISNDAQEGESNQSARGLAVKENNWSNDVDDGKIDQSERRSTQDRKCLTSTNNTKESEQGSTVDLEGNVNIQQSRLLEGKHVHSGSGVDCENNVIDRVLNNNKGTGLDGGLSVGDGAIESKDGGFAGVGVKGQTDNFNRTVNRTVNTEVTKNDSTEKHTDKVGDGAFLNNAREMGLDKRHPDKGLPAASNTGDLNIQAIDGVVPVIPASCSEVSGGAQGGIPEGSSSPTQNQTLEGQSYESLFAASSEVFAGVHELKSPGDGASETESEGKNEEKNEVVTPGTVKIDSNTKLHLMLEVFVHSEEKYLELFEVSSNHNQGEIRPGLLLLSTFAIYLLRNSEKKKRYKSQVRIPLEDLDSITVSMNYQILFVVFRAGKKMKTMALCTGDESLSKAILAHLNSACKESATFPPSVVTDALQHHKKLSGWAAKECRHSSKDIKLYSYNLIHWDDAVHPSKDPDMSVYRPVIFKAGHLSYKTKESLFLGSFWQPGYFVLKDCILNRYSERGSKKVQWSLQLSPPDFSGCRRLRQRDRGHCFEILQSKGSSYVMSCENERQLSSWLSAICQVMAEQQRRQACSPSGTPVQPCCSLVTSHKLLLFHEDSQTSFIRCLASCDVTSIVCLRSAETEPNCVIIDFLPEESETPWIFYFFSCTETLKFQKTLSTAYYEAAKTVLPLKHLADSRLKQRTKTCLTAVRASRNNKTATER